METRGRKKVNITKEQMIEAIRESASRNSGRVTQKLIADDLNVSYPTYLKLKQQYGLDPKSIALTPRIPALEYDDMSEEDFGAYMNEIESNKKPDAYKTFKYGFDESIILRPMYDLHLGSDTSMYDKIWENVQFIKKHSNVKTFFGGDMIDNFTKRSPGSAMYNQAIPVHEQKLRMEWIAKYLGKDKILGIIQGCHDEWSKKNDNFDFGKYIANKIGVPYLGFGANLELEVGDNLYKGYVSHKTRYYNKNNLCHGLKQHWRTDYEFDFGICGHFHRPNFEVFAEKGRTIKVMVCSGFKDNDRFLRQKMKEPHTSRRQCFVFLAEPVDPIELGIVYFEDIDQAVRFL